MATRSRTKADLEVIIANQRADIDALEQRSKDWLDQHEKIGDDWNRALNRVAELEKQLVRIASEKQAELDNLQAELRVAQNEAVTLRARVSELWRAFTHVTSAYAAKQWLHCHAQSPFKGSFFITFTQLHFCCNIESYGAY